jgi:excisionase family DNA binding protein
MPNQTIPEASGPLTIEQYCELWQVCRSTVYGWINKGMLDSVKVGGTRRILPKHDRAFRQRFESGIERHGTG